MSKGVDEVVEVISRRTATSLPSVPGANVVAGTVFFASVTVHGKDGVQIGDGSVNGMVVDIIPGLPVKLVVQNKIVLRLPDGELHLNNMHIREIPSPGKTFAIAVIGGTGKYRTARGDGIGEHATDTDTKITLNLVLT
ncbi:hypothetical protein [Amycolatopsis xylanica]|uniref:hypothetical protein n=1 Tax=Amycolatopsis xylanica TaxID=589385 RepID=UPI000B889754|nr:hypothetical protein [Amycolatopsis xylanica]